MTKENLNSDGDNGNRSDVDDDNSDSDSGSQSDLREDVLIVGHGNVFRYFLVRVMQFETDGWARFGTSNCGISRVNIMDDGTVRVTHWNDTGHLPQQFLTNNKKGSSL